MFQGLIAQLADEVMANVLLHRFLRFRRLAPARGPAPGERPGLYSGELADFYAPLPAPADLEADRVAVRAAPPAVVCDCRFASETQTGWPENDRVWCRHWQATGRDRGLTIVGVDGIVQVGTRWFRRLADVLNPHGIDVMAMDAPFNFRRTPRGYMPGQLIISGDLGHQLAVTRQGVLDLLRIVVTLQQQGRRVGLVGVSYGGWLTLLASLRANDLACLVAIAPPVDIIGMLQKRGGTIVRGVRRGIGYEPINTAELARVARPVVPSQWPSQAPGERISLHAARHDRLVPLRGIEELARFWKAKLEVHGGAHYGLAVSTRIIPQIADEICSMAERSGN